MAKKPGLSIGLTTGLTVGGFYTMILARAQSNGWTDKRIHDIVKAEFPHRKNVMVVRQARYFYNRGERNIGYGQPIPPQDRRYSRPFVDRRVSGGTIAEKVDYLSNHPPTRQPTMVHTSQ